MTSALFTPLAIRNRILTNRIWIAPMCQYSVEREDGVPTDWHLVHLGALAAGKPGLLLTEAAAIAPEGRISPQDVGIWNDEQVAAWRRITDFAHSVGTPIGVQLAHAGRKASSLRPWDGSGSVPLNAGGWATWAPSAVAFPGFTEPRALSIEQVRGIAESFAAAARRAVEAGFDAVEVHAAHGYLLHQFLSPLSNRRTDEFGGSLENRARLLLDTIRAVRAAVPDELPVLVRFSATDWLEGGWTVEETATVARLAQDAGADAFDISSGGLQPAHISVEPGYQVPLAAAVRAAVDVPVAAVGLITGASQAQAVLDEGSADAVLVARAALRDPHLPLTWAHDLGVTVPWPHQYERAALA